MFADISDTVWNGIIAGCVTVIISLISTFNGWLTRRQNAANAKEVKETTENTAVEVKQALVAHNEKTDEKMETIHTLVNSAFGQQLKVTADATNKTASITGDSADINAADAAKKLLDAHNESQAKADLEKKSV